MGQKYKQLDLEERCKISRLHEDGKSLRQIATTMARSVSTIARELKRNSTRSKGYEPSYAQVQTSGRRWRGSRLSRDADLRDIVLERLKLGWSPEQVVGYLKDTNGIRPISHESIYRFIDAQIRRKKDYDWRNYLPQRKSKRGRRGRKGKNPVLSIKHRVSINKRPAYIQKRRQPGHWEADLMLFGPTRQPLLALYERTSRFTFLFKQKNKQADAIAKTLKGFFSSLPPHLARTVTFDNGTEFSNHYELNKLGIQTYFCDVRSPWQKGGVENSIGRLRRYLPTKTDISTITQHHINNLIALHNQTPRKCLDFKTPAEIFYQKMLHFECESTSLLSQG